MAARLAGRWLPARRGVLALSVDLRHDAERPALGIFEERHPFFGTVGMLVDHVRHIGELDAARSQLLVRFGDVGHAEVNHGFPRRRPLLLRQHQPRSTAIEERELAEREQVRYPDHLAVPRLRLLDVANGSRYLA